MAIIKSRKSIYLQQIAALEKQKEELLAALNSQSASNSADASGKYMYVDAVCLLYV
jgi:hypothetical protein